MDTRIFTSLLLILLHSPISLTNTLRPLACPFDSFYNKATNRCQECTKFCARGIQVQHCSNISDIVCKTCAADSFFNMSSGLCQECTRFCKQAGHSLIRQCREDADAVCGVKKTSKKKSKKKNNRRNRKVVLTSSRLTLHVTTKPTTTKDFRSEAETTPFQTETSLTTLGSISNPNTKSRQQVKNVSNPDNYTSRDSIPSQNDEEGYRTGILSDNPSRRDITSAVQDPAGQSTNSMNSYLSVAVSIMGSLVVVGAFLLLALCLKSRCALFCNVIPKRDKPKDNGITMSDLTNQSVAFPVDHSLPGGTRPGRATVQNEVALTTYESTADVQIENGLAPTLLDPESSHQRSKCTVSSGNDQVTEGSGCHGGSMLNIYPPAKRVPSTVRLEPDGSTITCTSIKWNQTLPRCQDGSTSTMETVHFHHLPPNSRDYFMSSTFSLESVNGSVYAV